ncbi:ABC transporter permease [Actinomadura sp. BRA 177]|uniref:ABC transporter permease n=1 Tax=Actinomadura sp. BRA 177 TaxID=2745202 RepID=UPI001595618D|nr:ABC transporter permease [Actinomadura sp. BRA 177]NVI87878.1 ABC transporter permease [Actinomadura sp. BRA 177]
MGAAGLCLGVTAVTMGFGLHQTVSKILTADAEGHTSVSVGVDPRTSDGLSEQQVTALLQAQPGTAHVMSFRPVPVRVPGFPSGLVAEAYSGDYRPFLGDNLVRGRWFTGAGELVVTEALCRRCGLAGPADVVAGVNVRDRARSAWVFVNMPQPAPG